MGMILLHVFYVAILNNIAAPILLMFFCCIISAANVGQAFQSFARNANLSLSHCSHSLSNIFLNSILVRVCMQLHFTVM